ncbi:MAG TPA: biopolymer transporter ExbD [Gemmatimonadaceae bacterium]|nr:biopolymer transporter ExbD [Gemmatimonadaceae bacterium]
MSLRRGRARAELNAEINVVSLIDVMMLLLVIFMITAPLMQSGLDVQLPTGEAKPLDPKGGLSITVTRTRIYANQTGYTDAEFRAVIKQLAKDAREGVYFQGDSGVSYQRVVTVLSMAAAAGVKNVGMVMLPDDNRQ